MIAVADALLSCACAFFSLFFSLGTTEPGSHCCAASSLLGLQHATQSPPQQPRAPMKAAPTMSLRAHALESLLGGPAALDSEMFMGGREGPDCGLGYSVYGSLFDADDLDCLSRDCREDHDFTHE
jgi:hypothetical protein